METPENSQSQKESRAEQFFKNKITTIPVSKEEFLKIVKQKYPNKTEDDILQTKGLNFDHEGNVVVLLRTDIFPEEYLPYLETHEKWEAYVARKEGFNLFKKAVREYKNEKVTTLDNPNELQEFYDQLSDYNYEFRHEYAVYKEYKHALNDGKLDAYHGWLMNMRTKEIPTASPATLVLIENDTIIRESIYKKLKEGSKHHFLRK